MNKDCSNYTLPQEKKIPFADFSWVHFENTSLAKDMYGYEEEAQKNGESSFLLFKGDKDIIFKPILHVNLPVKMLKYFHK